MRRGKGFNFQGFQIIDRSGFGLGFPALLYSR